MEKIKKAYVIIDEVSGKILESYISKASAEARCAYLYNADGKRYNVGVVNFVVDED